MKRFYRSASFLPIQKDDQNDGTFMKGGKLFGLNIFKNNVSQNWGINGNNIDVAWLISSKRIEFIYKKDEESFNIIHRKE